MEVPTARRVRRALQFHLQDLQNVKRVSLVIFLIKHLAIHALDVNQEHSAIQLQLRIVNLPHLALPPLKMPHNAITALQDHLIIAQEAQNARIVNLGL